MKRSLFHIVTLLLFLQVGLAQKDHQQKIDSLEAAFKIEKVDSNKVTQIIHICREYYMSGKPEDALVNTQRVKPLLKRISKRKVIEAARLYHFAGLSCSNNSQYETALLFTDTLLEMRKSVGYDQGVAEAINQKGVYKWQLGDYPGALEFYMAALKISEKIKDTTLILNTYNNLGIVYYNLKKYQLSIDYYTNVLTHLDTNKHIFLRSNAFDNIGLVYMQLKDPNKALLYHQKAFEQKKKLKTERYISISYLNMGNAYSALGNKSEAILCYRKAIEIKQRINDLSGLAHCYNDISFILMEKKDYIGAKNNLIKGLDLAKKVNSLELIKELNKALAECYYKLNDLKLAYYHQQEYMLYKDSIFNNDNNNTMMELESKYQAKKKQIENTLLKQENKIHSLESEKKDDDIKKQRSVIWLVSLSLLIILGLALITLKNYKASQRANILIAAQKLEVERQKFLVDEHQKEILDSIHYAKRIQNTLMAHTDFVHANIPKNFILFKPKDIVSGDFYWATKLDHLFYLAVCDSTGHGVPGAFMSLLNINFLSEAINEKNIREPHKVFNYVRQQLINGISKEGQKDGFDGILICMDQKTKKITYTAANNAPIIIRNGEITELEKDRMPVGIGEKTDSFSLHQIELQANDSLYLYTDGYADQFGGPKGKKFLYKRLNELLKTLDPDELVERGDKLNNKFEEWKGSLEQVDDVLVIGIKI